MKNLIAAFLLVSASSLSLAEEAAPDALIRRFSEEILATMRADPELRTGNPAKVLPFVDRKILPHFDFARATRIAVGPSWRSATAEQREELTREFSVLLVRTYTAALAGLRDGEIAVHPLRTRPSDTQATVRSRVTRPGEPPLAIEYEMKKTENRLEGLRSAHRRRQPDGHLPHGVCRGSAQQRRGRPAPDLVAQERPRQPARLRSGRIATSRRNLLRTGQDRLSPALGTARRAL